MDKLDSTVLKQTAFGELDFYSLGILKKASSRKNYEKGQFIFRSNEQAKEFYLIYQGDVSLEIYSAEKGIVKIQNLSSYDVLGWSWLFPPYKWHFDAYTLEDTELIVFDAKAILEMSKKNHEFGYNMLNIFSKIMLERLQETRLRLLNFYNLGGNHE